MESLKNPAIFSRKEGSTNRMNIFLETCEDKFKIQCAKMTPEYQAASIVIVSSPVLPKYISDCIILSKKSSEKW